MDLAFDISLANGYKSSGQRIRLMSETWAAENLYCPCCGSEKITRLPNNMPVADFICESCNEIFELKSKLNHFGKKIVDGAYQTAIERISGNKNPDLFALVYSGDYRVKELAIIPKYFFTVDVIEKRKPLAETARRAGWVGSNILFADIPQQGKINIIKNSVWLDREQVVSSYNESKKLKFDNLAKRGWLMDVLQCVNRIKATEFSLRDIYAYVTDLKIKHPENNNIEAKIRQQLQLLRDKGFLIFMGNGQYRKVIK